MLAIRYSLYHPEVQTVIDDISLGGMAYERDPEFETPPGERPKEPEEPEEDCEDIADKLLDCIVVTDDDVSSVDVTSVSLDIVFEEEDG